MCNISLDRIINLQNKLVPEMVDLLTERYKVLRQISHDQPIGRRTLAKKLGLSERILRSHVDFLKEAGLLDFTLTGMSITEEGAVLLQELRDYVNRLQKLSSLERILQDKLHLQKVVVLPGNADQDKVVTREIGRVAAGILLRLLADHKKHIVAVTGGTTVAAMAAFGTGTCPGLTAMAGYTQLEPASHKLIQLIQFKDALAPKPANPHIPVPPMVDPLDLQREETVFEKLAAQEVRVTSSGLPKFSKSPLTEAALRGTDYQGNVTPRDRVLAAARASRTPGLTYLYIRDADKVGHNYGWDSEHWVAAFEHIDAQLALLKRSAPKGTLIVIVADHGMVQTDMDQRIDIAVEPQLTRGVSLVGGEPRSLMLYAEPDERPEDIACRWRDCLQDRALVRTKDEAIADGLFGPVCERVRPMLGDVVVQAAGAVTLVDSRTQGDKATHLPSVHGSQTALEMDIPCLIDMA